MKSLSEQIERLNEDMVRTNILSPKNNLLFWMVYFLIDYVSSLLIDPDQVELFSSLFNFIFVLIFFYGTCFVVIPRSIPLKNKRYILLKFILLLVIIIQLKWLLMPSVVAMEMPYLKFFMIELIRCFHFSILAALVCFILISFKKLKEQYSIQLAARQAELAQYQLMMNPHFIANGLNAIQSDFILGDARAKDNLVTFTEMLTYCFTNSTQKIIKLSEELACIEKFIQFQKHRYGKKLHLSYELKDEAQYCSVLEIPKMTLLTLVENVFKHGRVNDQNCAPIIQISILPDEKYITVLVAIKNAVNENNKAVISSKSGFLAVSHILKSYFDDRYDLSYFSQGDLFTLNLILKYER